MSEAVEYLSPKELAARLPGTPTEVTVRNWMTTGFTVRVRGETGTFRLKHHCIGLKLFTSAAWAQEFFEEIQQFRDQAYGFGQEGEVA